MAESEHEHLINHLRDTHALEQQSIRQLERSQEMSQAGDMRDLYGEHLEETREHERLISERIESKDLKPSAVKDLTMRAGAIGLRQLAEIPPDTPVKLAMHFYALEHLEIATYEALVHIARREGDDETAQVAEQILEQERAAAEKIGETFERAVELMYEQAEQAEESERSDQPEKSEGAEEREPARSS